MSVPKIDMYNTMYPSHLIHVNLQSNHIEGRTYPSQSSFDLFRVVPRNNEGFNTQRKDYVLQSHSALNLPHNSTKNTPGSQGSSKTYHHKREYWNSRSQGKSKRLQHGNSAPCLITAITDESGDSGISRSPTPNKQHLQQSVSNRPDSLPNSRPESRLSGRTDSQIAGRAEGMQRGRPDPLNTLRPDPLLGRIESHHPGRPEPLHTGRSDTHLNGNGHIDGRTDHHLFGHSYYNGRVDLHPANRMDSSKPSNPWDKECTCDGFGNVQHPGRVMNQRRDGQQQAKRRGSSFSNNRNQAAFFRHRKPTPNIILHYPTPFPPSTLFTPYYTAPDRFMLRSHLMSVTQTPSDLLDGSVWDQLSQGTWTKFYVNQQSQNTFERKMGLWKYLYVYIKQYFPKYGLYLVGSTMNGFGSDYSDVDMCLLIRYAEVDQRNEAVSYLNNILKLLERCEFVEKLELIQAKVPLLKFRDSKQGLQVDLNCNNSVGIRNTHLLYCYGQMDWRVKPLVLVVKLWAQWHSINDAKNMTISSYSFALMVIHFLQCGVDPQVLPCLHSMYSEKFSSDIDIGSIDIQEQLEPFQSENKQPLGELLYEFFQYYASFDFLKYAISVRLGSVIPVEECRHVRSLKNDPHQWKFLCIEEPFDLTNTARSVYDPDKFDHIRSIFIKTAHALVKCKKLESIFNLDGP